MSNQRFVILNKQNLRLLEANDALIEALELICDTWQNFAAKGISDFMLMDGAVAKGRAAIVKATSPAAGRNKG